MKLVDNIQKKKARKFAFKLKTQLYIDCCSNQVEESSLERSHDLKKSTCGHTREEICSHAVFRDLWLSLSCEGIGITIANIYKDNIKKISRSESLQLSSNGQNCQYQRA